ncbi:predicted protein [Arabidopsis lyrata subsp. lyrata]|uniref:AP complex subunit sigma n=1 Tax=Arabidopsis lyrata subsp. lyrata TaxID=81972 RepID=D7MD07_ARALL|nr:predicted protein [Arabidopsis lyrata subsp. lyrata]
MSILIMDNYIYILISRQGKVRLTKWYSPYAQKERSKHTSLILHAMYRLYVNSVELFCNFVEWRGYKVVYKRYASLYFCMCIDQEDNELEVLDIIHHYAEILWELQESSKKTVARIISAQDQLVEVAKEETTSISNIIAQATK